MMRESIRSAALATIVAVACSWSAEAAFVTVDDFSDVLVWAGMGANEAGFVLQFGDGVAPTSIAWGYRWNGSATVQDMLFAIAGTTTISGGSPPLPGVDDRLTVDGAEFDFGFGPVVLINSVTYDQAGLPSEWFQGDRQIMNNYAIDGTFPALYSNAGAGGTWPGGPFDAATVGASDLALTDGGWYGFVQVADTFPMPLPPFNFTQPVSAVPEPGIWALAASAVVALFTMRRRISRT